jgi:hypothetical protein
MSLVGQTETSARSRAMSVPPPIAGIITLHAQVRSVPLTVVGGTNYSEPLRILHSDRVQNSISSD